MQAEQERRRSEEHERTERPDAHHDPGELARREKNARTEQTDTVKPRSAGEVMQELWARQLAQATRGREDRDHEDGR